MAKRRADQLLVDRGLAESRAKAQALILAGLVLLPASADRQGRARLAAERRSSCAARTIPGCRAAGIKLAPRARSFRWDVTGAVALDVGSSTGGFTDVLLRTARHRSLPSTSGTDQLAWRLRQDPRVVVREHTQRPLPDAARSSPSRST